MQPRIANEYIVTLLEIAEQRGLSPLQLSSAANVDLATQTFVTCQQLSQLLAMMDKQQPDASLGLRVGLCQQSHGHGYLGYAAKSSRHLLDAVVLDEQYLQCRVTHASIRMIKHQQQCTLVLQLEEPWQPLKPFVTDLVFASLISFYRSLFPDRNFAATIKVSYPAPVTSHHAQLTPGIHWQFNQAADALTCPLDILTSPLPTRDDHLKQLAEQQCAELLPPVKDIPYNELVRATLANNLGLPIKLEQVAQQLGLHERTLKRRLKQEGYSYQQILQTLRCEQARRLLQHTDTRIADIALQLGYANDSTFKRLFKQWTGHTPGQVRKQSVRSIREQQN